MAWRESQLSASTPVDSSTLRSVPRPNALPKWICRHQFPERPLLQSCNEPEGADAPSVGHPENTLNAPAGGRTHADYTDRPQTVVAFTPKPSYVGKRRGCCGGENQSARGTQTHPGSTRKRSTLHPESCRLGSVNPPSVAPDVGLAVVV